MHDRSVCETASTIARSAIKEAKAQGFRVNINCTLFGDADPERVARFFDSVKAMGVDGITVSPGYAYERAPDQEHFLNARAKQLFRDIFKRSSGGRRGRSANRAVLDFSLATRNTNARRTGVHSARCSAVASVLSARRRLRAYVSRIDG